MAFESFLAARRQLLADAINTYMDSLLAERDQRGFTIHDFIARGEGPSLEFKSSVRWDTRQQNVNKELERSIAKTIAGFMNRDGGTLVIGVSDDGQILGLEADMASLKKPSEDGLSLHLTEVLNKYLGEVAAAAASISFAHVDGDTIAVVSAEPSTRPVFLDDGSGPEFYLRSNAASRLLDVKEATQYIAQRWPGVA
jgi:predicted HTH transcriptional regulator